jgi:hypothetical protein
LEKETNLRLVVQNCWPNVSIPGDLSGWHNHNQLFQSLLESPDNDAERLLRLAYLISEWKMAGNTQQLQVGLLKKCADLATKNNIHDATLIAAWILLDCSEEVCWFFLRIM